MAWTNEYINTVAWARPQQYYTTWGSFKMHSHPVDKYFHS